MSGPYEGLRVVDLTSVIVGPYTTQLLGDMGADVIKIETPEGDSTRRTGPSVNDGMSSHFLNVNRNKRSLVLDLKHPDGAAALRRLVATADMFVHNMRAEPLARLGFAYEAVSRINPGVIFCGIAGFGRNGRYAGRAAYDDVIQGASGIADLQGRSSTGKAHYIAMLTADKTTALFAVHAIGAALYWRARTGAGQEIEVPMFESMVSFNMLEHLWGRSFEPPRGTTGSVRHATPLRRPYLTKEGYICMLPTSDRHWQAFFEVAGEPHWLKDPRFASRQLRTQNHAALYAEVERLLLTKTAREWDAALAPRGVPCMPIASLEDVVEDPHLADVGFFRELEHPSEGVLRQLGIPVKLFGSPGSIRRLPPRLGEHSAEVLGELGYGAAEIEAMAAAGATRVGI